MKTYKVAILAADGFEQSELFEPLDAFKQAGVEVKIVSLKPGEIRAWNHTDWGKSISVDMTVKECRPEDFDALVLPGGLMSPDILRQDMSAVGLISTFSEQGKVIAAICHAPWLLIEADLVEDRNVTSYPSVKTDLLNAGAHWKNEAVVVDAGMITSRSPADIPAFCKKILEEMKEGAQHHLSLRRHQNRSPDSSLQM